MDRTIQFFEKKNMNYTIDTLTGSSTASNANWIVSLSDTYEYMNVDTSGQSIVSDFYSNCISRASTKIESIIKNPVALQSYLGILDGSGSNEINLSYFPVVSVSTLQYRTTPSYSWQNIITNGSISENCLIYTYKLKLYNYSFPYGDQNIRIIYNAGYHSIPNDIKDIALEMIEVMIRGSKKGNSNGTIGIQSISQGSTTNENVTYKDMLPEWSRRLENYKRIR